jgi:hypothetical protein
MNLNYLRISFITYFFFVSLIYDLNVKFFFEALTHKKISKKIVLIQKFELFSEHLFNNVLFDN